MVAEQQASAAPKLSSSTKSRVETTVSWMWMILSEIAHTIYKSGKNSTDDCCNIYHPSSCIDILKNQKYSPKTLPILDECEIYIWPVGSKTNSIKA